jgi:hypothetical protein
VTPELPMTWPASVRWSAWLCRPVNDLQTIVRNVKIKLEPKRLRI